MSEVNELEFAFRLGYMIGFIGNNEGRTYLLKHGVKQVDIDNFHVAGKRIAEAFYDEPEPMVEDASEEYRGPWCDEVSGDEQGFWEDSREP